MILQQTVLLQTSFFLLILEETWFRFLLYTLVTTQHLPGQTRSSLDALAEIKNAKDAMDLNDYKRLWKILLHSGTLMSGFFLNLMNKKCGLGYKQINIYKGHLSSCYNVKSPFWREIHSIWIFFLSFFWNLSISVPFEWHHMGLGSFIVLMMRYFWIVPLYYFKKKFFIFLNIYKISQIRVVYIYIL